MIFHENLMKIRPPRFPMILLTYTVPGNSKINLGFHGLIATSRKCCSSFIVSCLTFDENFMEILSSVFQYCCQQTQIPLKTQKKKPSTQGVKHDTPKFFQIGPCIMPDVSWKFNENPLTRFSVITCMDNALRSHYKRISVVKVRRFHDHLIFIMEIRISTKKDLNSEIRLLWILWCSCPRNDSIQSLQHYDIKTRTWHLINELINTT